MARVARTNASPIDVRAIRKLAGLSQTQFWGRIGITQSGGCRYESGRAMPATVRLLIELTYALGDKAAANRLADLRKAA